MRISEASASECVQNIVHYLDNDGNLVIPDHIEGKPVTRLYGNNCGTVLDEIKTITFPSTLLSDDNVFDTFANLESVTFLIDENGNGIKRIGNIHSDSEKFTEMALPDSLEVISLNAHDNFNTLKIPKSVKTVVIDDYSKIKNFLVDEQNPIYCDINNHHGLLDKTSGVLMAYSDDGNNILSDDVQIINSYVCQNLTMVTLPDNIKEIRDFSFLNETAKLISVNYRNKTYTSISELKKALEANNVKIGELAFVLSGLAE